MNGYNLDLPGGTSGSKLKGSSVPRLVGGAALAAFGARSNNRRVDRRHKQGPNYGSTRTLPRPPATAAAPDITMSPLSAGGGKYRAAVFAPDHDRPHRAIDLESSGVLERPRSRSGTRVIGPPPGTQHRSDGSLRDHHGCREGLLGRWRYQTRRGASPRPGRSVPRDRHLRASLRYTEGFCSTMRENYEYIILRNQIF